MINQETVSSNEVDQDLIDAGVWQWPRHIPFKEFSRIKISEAKRIICAICNGRITIGLFAFDHLGIIHQLEDLGFSVGAVNVAHSFALHFNSDGKIDRLNASGKMEEVLPYVDQILEMLPREIKASEVEVQVEREKKAHTT
jgi:hypothetical protein